MKEAEDDNVEEGKKVDVRFAVVPLDVSVEDEAEVEELDDALELALDEVDDELVPLVERAEPVVITLVWVVQIATPSPFVVVVIVLSTVISSSRWQAPTVRYTSSGGCTTPVEASRSYDDRDERKKGAVYHSCSHDSVRSPQRK